MSMLTMIHPEVTVTAQVVDAGVFNAVWAPRGWELLGPAESYASEVLGTPVKDAEALKVKELRALIASRDLPYPGAGVLKAELLEIFRGTFPELVGIVATAPDPDPDPDPAGGSQLSEAELAELAELEAEEAEAAAALAEARAEVASPDPVTPDGSTTDPNEKD